VKKFDHRVIRKFDPYVIRKFDPSVAVIFDPAVAMIFDPADVMIFDPAGNNKFNRAVIKDIRPPRQDSLTPTEPKDFARHTSTPRSRHFDDFSDR
jgi:hypothetical protein